MVFNETLNLTAEDLPNVIAPALTGNLLPLINILKTAGIIFIVYLVLLIFQGILKFKDRQRLKRIENKLDLLLKKKKN